MAHGGGNIPKNEIQPEISVELSWNVLANVSIDTIQDITSKRHVAFHELRNRVQINGTFEDVVDVLNVISKKKRGLPLYFDKCTQIPALCRSLVLYMKYVEERKWDSIEKKFNVTLKLSPNNGSNETSLAIYPRDPSSRVFEAEGAFTHDYLALSDKSIKNVEITLGISDDASLKSVYLEIEKRYPKVMLVEDASKITLIGCEKEVKDAELLFTQEMVKRKGSSHNSGLQQNEKYSDKTELDKCKHSFCKICIDKAFKVKKACPICNTAYGILRGNQPEGTMAVYHDVHAHLPGFDGCGSIEITYKIPSGTQGSEHPHPGRHFVGTVRTAYLPDTKEGNRVLNLLRKAFDQRLIFTVGMSRTTGADNSVTWNDIHHKTSKYGGSLSFGYPDPDYMNRVQEELKAKGIY
uniref:uncharacterized protein isoform X2 n=1 Tax=Myxine glutinosa TaxID=7769 RepID=UPI00358E6AE2